MRHFLILLAGAGLLYCLMACNKESIIEGFVPQKPVIDSISPQVGMAGTLIKLYGHWYDSTKSNVKVMIGDDSAFIASFNDSVIIVRALNGVTSGAVSVTTPDGKATGPVFYVVTDTAAPTKSLGFIRFRNYTQPTLYLNVAGQALQASTVSTDYWEQIAIGNTGYFYWREKTSGLYLNNAGGGAANVTGTKAPGAIWRMFPNPYGAGNLLQSFSSGGDIYVLSGQLYCNTTQPWNSAYLWISLQ